MTEPDASTQPCPSCGKPLTPTDAGGLRCETDGCASAEHPSSLPPRDARERSNEPTGADDVGG